MSIRVARSLRPCGFVGNEASADDENGKAKESWTACAERRKIDDALDDKFRLLVLGVSGGVAAIIDEDLDGKVRVRL